MLTPSQISALLKLDMTSICQLLPKMVKANLLQSPIRSHYTLNSSILPILPALLTQYAAHLQEPDISAIPIPLISETTHTRKSSKAEDTPSPEPAPEPIISLPLSITSDTLPAIRDA